jgi:hypothetical protein
VTVPFQLYPAHDPIPAPSRATADPPPQPMTVFAPLYPVALAPLVGVFNREDAGRLFGALAIGLFVALAGWAPYVLSRRPEALWIGPLLVLASPDLLLIFTNVESEALFVLPLELSVVGLACYLRRPSRPMLVLSAAAAAFAALTRYAGAGFIAGGAVVLLLLAGDGWRSRFGRSITFTAIAGLPVLAWVLTHGTGRQLKRHRPTAGDLREAGRVVASWVLPSNPPPLAGLIVGLAVVALVVWLWWRHRDEAGAAPAVILALAAGYLVVLLGTMTFYDAATRIDARTLAPVHVFLLIAVTQLGALAIATSGNPAHRLTALAAAVALVLGAVAVGRSAGWLHGYRANDLEYASPYWKHSALLSAVGRLPAVPLFSNAADLIYARTGRAAYALPENRDPTSLVANPALSGQVASLGQVLRLRAGVVVYMDVSRYYVVNLDVLERQLPLKVVDQTPDGVILRLSS